MRIPSRAQLAVKFNLYDKEVNRLYDALTRHLPHDVESAFIIANSFLQTKGVRYLPHCTDGGTPQGLTYLVTGDVAAPTLIYNHRTLTVTIDRLSKLVEKRPGKYPTYTTELEAQQSALDILNNFLAAYDTRDHQALTTAASAARALLNR
jgi:hypothetical protein